MKTEEQIIDAVEKVLKEPVATEFSEHALKIRTNLIIAAAMAVTIVVADLEIHPDSSFLGLRFSQLTDTVVRTGLFAIVLYLLCHFLWVAWDAFLEWRVRITGARRGFATGAFYAPDHADEFNDPRQSTLHNWWSQQAPTIGNLADTAAQMQKACGRWESQLREAFKGTPDWSKAEHVITALATMKEEAAKLSGRVERAEKVMNAPRLLVSLQRFDRWSKLFLRSQSLRWVFVDVAAPVAFAAFALYLIRP